MVKKTISLILIGSLLTGCAGWTPNYEAMGKLGKVTNIEKKVLPQDIEVYVQEYPEGFIYNDGIVSTTNDANTVLGEIKVELKMPNPVAVIIVMVATLGIGVFFMMPHGISRDDAIKMLKEKASEVGANAVIGVNLPSKEQHFAGASGIAVIMVPTK